MDKCQQLPGKRSATKNLYKIQTSLVFMSKDQNSPKQIKHE